MKNKSCKGVTLTSLVITIIVLLIIASVSINYGKELLDKSNVESIKTNMLLIEAKVKVYAEEANFSGDDTTFPGTKVSAITEGIVKEFNTNAGGIYSDYYYLSQDDLNDMGLSIKEGNYLVNYDYNNIDVVYIEGVTINGNKYHNMFDIEAQ